VVAQALAAGVRIVQLRHKAALGAALLAEARELTALCHAHDALLIVNDRADVALAAGADGVHVGQEDLPLAAARQVVGSDLLVGVSASYPEEAEAADRGGAAYLGFGAMYPTPTKPDAEYAGPAQLAAVKRRVRLPVVAIGGITAANAAEVLGAGADLIAVVGAVFGSEEPGAAVHALLAACAPPRD
jgi:thiamine-phosphate pyrophosphorylase